MLRWSILGLLLAHVAYAEPPEGWIGRVTPGFGFASDDTMTCPLHGRMFDGGFSVGRAIGHGLVIGGDAAIAFNTQPADRSCGDRLAIETVIGALVDWYPTRTGVHALATLGIADLETAPRTDLYGLGGTVALGYEWGGPLRAGFELRVSAMRGSGHSIVAPALLFTIAFDSSIAHR